MSDQTTKKKEVTKPPFDPHKLLDQLRGIVEKKAPTKGGGRSWVSALIVITVVLVGVAVWYWISFRRGRELAKLRHEKNEAKILKETAVAHAQVAANNEYVEKWEKIFNMADDRLKIIEADIKAEEKRYEADMRAIDSIRSWRDAGVR